MTEVDLQARAIQRRLLFVARILAIVLLAVSPRALTAPALSFNRAQESKRPKPLKNIVRTNSPHVSNAEKQGKEPRPPRTVLSLQESRGSLSGRIGDSSLPPQGFTQLTKPDYLRFFLASLPQSQTSPPA